MCLVCNNCGEAMRWRCARCACESYTPTQRGYVLGFWGSLAVGFLGIEDWRTQVLAAQGFDREHERAIQCNGCGEVFCRSKGTMEEALRCDDCGKGHYVVEMP